MASIIPKAEGKYKIQVLKLIDPTSGKKFFKSMTYEPKGKTKREKENDLKRKAAEFELQIKEGKYIDPKEVTFSKVAAEWLELKYKEVATRTAESYENQLKKRINPAFGHVPITELSAYHIQAFYNDLEKQGLSAKTIKRYKDNIRGILKYAYQMNIVNEIVSDRCTVPKIHTDTKLHFFDAEQTKAFLNCLKTEHLQYQVFFNLALYGGFRLGEMIALTWQDIDYKESVISINKAVSYSRTKGQYIKEPKSKSSIRKVVIPSKLIPMLKAWQREQKELRFKLGSLWQGEKDLTNNAVFIQLENGKRMHSQTPRKRMEKIIIRYNATIEKEADKLPMIRLHDLRHTCATHLLANKTDIETVSHRLGHAKASITLDVYGHYLPQKDREAAEYLNTLFA